MEDLQQRLSRDGLPYADYLARWREKLSAPLQGLDKTARKYVYYARYNEERSRRVQAAYEVSGKLRAALEGIEAPQRWMVITEDWCGDSAYGLPVIARAAEASEQVTLRILLRDANLDVMDRYLTGGARSIPKLVAFAEDGEELFRWGPRPAEAQALRERLKAEGVGGPEITQAVVDWYEAGGWREVDGELAALVAAVPSADVRR